ncbi:MAG: alanine racemase [Chloroflexota bacterium]
MNAHQALSTWAEVDLAAIENNVRLTKAHTNVQVMAIVKANAYGHGALPVARAALRAGATWLSVARIEEALELRQAGLECPILLLGYIPPAQVQPAIQNQFSITVWSQEQIEQAASIAARIGSKARLHLKVDTGMSRLGVQPGTASGLASLLAHTPAVLFEGLFTHFARADETDPTTTDLQASRFLQVLKNLDELAIHPSLVHAANSAASLTRSSASFDMVRLGIAMYGLHPSAECPLPADFRPALTWKTVLSQVKTLPAGRGVSYGHEYVTQKVQERIGTVPVGYADGFRRTSGNQALVGGCRVLVIGRVCMDQIMLQLDQVPEAKAGDEVVLIGFQGQEHLSAEQVARHWHTINYEVTCGIGSRVPRLYLNSD